MPDLGRLASNSHEIVYRHPIRSDRRWLRALLSQVKTIHQGRWNSVSNTLFSAPLSRRTLPPNSTGKFCS
jgi:hypothetical protein